MNINELTFEVRDKSLTRLGVILPDSLDFDYTGIQNNVGSWKLTIPSEHPLAPALRAPGAGIVVTGQEGTEIISGPTSKPELSQTPQNVMGSVTVEGITDTIVLLDALAYPDPSVGDATAQTKARDEREGSPEDLMRQFVNANIGPNAPGNRRKANLTLAPSLSRPAGVTMKKGARFPVLGELLEDIAIAHGLGFQVIQRGNGLRFETYEIVDRTKTIRLDVRNGSLSSQRVATAPPGVTRVVVAGQNEGVDRQFLNADTPESLTAESQWGRRIERFVDQRQTDDLDELQQAADEVLAEEGLTAITIQAIPAEDSAMRFGRDWYMGDSVSVVIDNQELVATVTGMVLKVDQEGVRTGVIIGDPTGFNADALVRKRLSRVDNRISALERVEPVATVADATRSLDFAFVAAAASWELTHNFKQRDVFVTAYDNTGAEIVGDVEYVTEDLARISWYYPTAGTARVQT